MTETTTNAPLMYVTSADSVKPTGAQTPADALGNPSMSTNESETQESHECPTCGRDDFKTVGGMKNHHAHIHGESIAGVERECGFCGEEFRVNPAYVDRGDGRFCSKSCKGKALSDGSSSEVTCEWCGETFQACNARIERGDCRFCSSECYGDWQSENLVGEDNPLWEGGPAPYYGSDWQQQRERALQRDNRECVICGDNGNVHVHHIRPFRKFGAENHETANRLDNLVCLCADHHMKWEGIPLRPEVAE